MKLKIAVYQHELIGKIDEKDLAFLQKEKPDILSLPEYFFHPELISYDAAVSYMEKVSRDLECVLIGGTVLKPEEDKLYNISCLFDRGKLIGSYKKVNLYFMEKGHITPGNEYKVFDLGSLRIGLLICADVLQEAAWRELAKMKPHLICIPTFSPHKEESVEEKFKRDEDIFVRGAAITGAAVVKVCGIGTHKSTRLCKKSAFGPISSSLFASSPHVHIVRSGLSAHRSLTLDQIRTFYTVCTRLQGRSLAATGQGIIWRVSPEAEDKKVLKILEQDI